MSSRPTINFISNLPFSEISGGHSAVGRAFYDALAEFAEVVPVGPIDPPASISAKARSKISRLFGQKGNFHFFSDERLKKIDCLVTKHASEKSDLDFFHGFTPWIRCKSGRPYLAWSDCSFQDYIEIYHEKSSFKQLQLDRIECLEAEWLEGAEAVFLSSDWAIQRVSEQYGIDKNKMFSTGIFGAMEPPIEDRWKGGKAFYFISTNYEQKNGPICRRVMDELWKTHPDVTLRIIGDPPPNRDLLPGRVIFEGFFDKANVDELREYRSHLADAFAILHPTDADTTAMVIIEAAFFGCPAISVNDFAIPEVSGGNTAVLLERPVSPQELIVAMRKLLDDENAYLQKRQQVRAHALANHLPECFKENFRGLVRRVLSGI